MLVTWKYKPRDTLIQKLDPRARLIFYGCYLLSVFMFWDLRALLVFMIIALLAVFAARLSWRDTRRTWIFIGAFPSHMLFAPTVREELSFGPKNIGLDAVNITENVMRALAAVNLPGYEDMPPLAMSFGQQKRISIASVLTMNPRVLVMDEPNAGQDYANYTHFMNDIVGQDKGLTGVSREFDAVLFITHDLDLAITYANRILLVADGSLVADGRPQDVLKDRVLLERCRVRPTSLLEANMAALPQTGRFLPAPALADYTW